MINDTAATRRDILQAMPGTIYDLARRSGYHERTVRRWVKTLQAASDSHVGSWLRNTDGGRHAAIYHAGAGRNMPCPYKQRANSESWARYVKSVGRDTVRSRQRTTRAIRRGDHLKDPLQQAAFNLVKVTNEQHSV